ncbi:MAG: RimK family protein [Myxococcales bacterium]|nr:RimK family protein [Myxococcales bacterium]
MPALIVVNNPARWPLKIPGVEVVAARTYLTDADYVRHRGLRVYNLCRSYAYQSLGYYTSLLAEARGHRPMPNVATIEDLRSQLVTAIVSEDLQDLIAHSFARIESSEYILSIYFGKTLAERNRRLGVHLFNQIRAPLLRARFVKRADGWALDYVGPVPSTEIPESHRDFVIDAAAEYLTKGHSTPRRPKPARFDLAILHEPGEASPPSNERAIKRFTKAAEDLGMDVTLITKDDYGRLAEFDGLFIRTTTYVNRYPYRFARRAAAEGLVVIDDPQSILRCTNKVYLAELLERHEISAPETIIVHRDNAEELPERLGLPFVLKQPDSAFSRGVIKVNDAAEAAHAIREFLDDSELLVAQRFLPTTFDWRVGVLDREPLYVCRYHMARKHWQIVQYKDGGKKVEGNFDTLAVADAPPQVVRTALRAANLIGDGLYGVDLKQDGRKVYVIEVNDNPNIDAGIEDKALGDGLYRAVMEVFLDRMERRAAPEARS